MQCSSGVCKSNDRRNWVFWLLLVMWRNLWRVEEHAQPACSAIQRSPKSMFNLLLPTWHVGVQQEARCRYWKGCQWHLFNCETSEGIKGTLYRRVYNYYLLDAMHWWGKPARSQNRCVCGDANAEPCMIVCVSRVCMYREPVCKSKVCHMNKYGWPVSVYEQG